MEKMNVKEVKRIKREIEKANRDYAKAWKKGDVEKMNEAEERRTDLMVWMYEEYMKQEEGGKVKVRRCRECAYFRDCYEEDGEIEYNEEQDVAVGVADNCEYYEGYDPEDYMDDGDDRGDCVSTMSEEEGGEVQESDECEVKIYEGELEDDEYVWDELEDDEHIWDVLDGVTFEDYKEEWEWTEEAREMNEKISEIEERKTDFVKAYVNMHAMTWENYLRIKEIRKEAEEVFWEQEFDSLEEKIKSLNEEKYEITKELCDIDDELFDAIHELRDIKYIKTLM